MKTRWVSKGKRSAETRARIAVARTTHGKSGSPEYKSWEEMKYRCLSPSSANYPNYGGRGIKVCARWLSFENFLFDMGPRPNGTSIDRIDNDGNYELGNCRWATVTQQRRNKRSNVFLSLNGETKCIGEWEKLLGAKRGSFWLRHKRGWTDREILTTPFKSAREDLGMVVGQRESKSGRTLRRNREQINKDKP